MNNMIFYQKIENNYQNRDKSLHIYFYFITFAMIIKKQT